MEIAETTTDGGMKRVQFSVTYPERLRHPLHREILDQPSLSRAELLMWSPTAEATTLCWVDGDRATTETAVGAVASLQESTFVPDAEGTYAFLQQAEYEFPGTILEAIGAATVIFVPPVVFLDTGEIQFEAVGETTGLGALHEELAGLGELTIERVHEFERASTPSPLTERQRAALDAAVEAGYYNVPREGSVADIAAALECSTSTAGELLRKAEAAVVQDYVGRAFRDRRHP
jgi:hypothetical protein